jgi:hypothetical protein
MGAKCELCGEPMPEGEEMFKFHGYSGPCPKPPLDRPKIEEPKMAIIEASQEYCAAHTRWLHNQSSENEAALDAARKKMMSLAEANVTALAELCRIH